MARRLMAITALGGIVLAVWRFAVENATAVTVRLLVGEASDVALWLALFVAFAAGALAVGFGSLIQFARSALIARRYRKTVAGLEAEVHQLRNLPLVSERPASSDGVLASPPLASSGRGSGAGA